MRGATATAYSPVCNPLPSAHSGVVFLALQIFIAKINENKENARKVRARMRGYAFLISGTSPRAQMLWLGDFLRSSSFLFSICSFNYFVQLFIAFAAFHESETPLEHVPLNKILAYF